MKRAVIVHIEKIRHANDTVKRWWVIGATTIVMCVIIILWIIYISATLPQTSNSAISATDNSNASQIEPKKTNPSFFGTIIEGIKITSNNTWGSFRSFGMQFSKGIQGAIDYTTKKKEIIIQKEPKEAPFIPNDPEPLEPVQLPSR
jgi:predicted PurR-regulated permease PerM